MIGRTTPTERTWEFSAGYVNAIESRGVCVIIAWVLEWPRAAGQFDGDKFLSIISLSTYDK